MENKIKRHFYNQQHYLLDKENQVVRLMPEFHEKLLNKKLWGKFGFKKIGGSSIGDVLLVDSFKSQFVAFCRMAWVGLPILDRKYVDAGISIEPKVIGLIEEVSGKQVETFDPYKYNFDYFAGKDDILGGLPDGFIKETNTVLEIKTTGLKNLQKWNKYGVPAAYLRQAQLYAYLMEVDKFSIVATFLEEQDYIDPGQFPIKERKTKNWNYNVNLEQVKDDIKITKDWYKEMITKGVSPKYDEKLDNDLLEWLDCANQEEWEALKNKWTTEGKIKI